MKFAKVFDIGDDQLLATKDWNDETDMFEIVLISYISNIRAELCLGFKDEEECNESFDKISQEQATVFYNKLKSQAESLMEG